MEKNKKELKCKNCIYYTGITCHGHGDYWGECGLLINMRKLFSKIFNVYEYDIKRKGSNSCWDNILDDNSKCMFFEIEEKY